MLIWCGVPLPGRSGFKEEEGMTTAKDDHQCPLMPKEHLSPREKEILPLVAQGLNNREIGKLLFISEKTAKNYVTSIKKKLGLANRTQIALYAIKEGLVQIDKKSD